MRAKTLLIVSLAVLSGACSGAGSGTNAPPPIDKKLLAGKWKSSSESLIITGYEFGEEGTLKVTIRGMEKPIEGRYAWNGERTLGLEYQTTAEVQQAYEAAAKAYKENVEAQIKSGKLLDRAGPSMLSGVPDKWPTAETIQVAISETPRLLILTKEGEGSQTFEKAD
jgi:hypothetical protein